MILIADSGSTKTDWVLASDDGLVIKSTQTEGITPVHQTAEYISQVLQSVCLLLVPESSSLAAIYFYGSGILPSVQSRMEEMLRQHFPGHCAGAQKALLVYLERVPIVVYTMVNK